MLKHLVAGVALFAVSALLLAASPRPAPTRTCEAPAHAPGECPDCKGSGRGTDCFKCSGMGRILERCGPCDGTGKSQGGMTKGQSCTNCGGKGMTLDRCLMCSGQGKLRCMTCSGSGRVPGIDP